MDLIVELDFDWYVPMRSFPLYREQTFVPWYEDGEFFWVSLNHGLVC